MASPPPARSPYVDLPVGHHRLGLLKDGVEAFPSMLGAIAGARSTICLETYILRDDRTGRRFAAALAERARAGVEVNLLYDAWGSSVSRDLLADLNEAGVRTLAFHPIRFQGRLGRMLFRLRKRNHRKALVVDGRIAFTGGLNIADDYTSREEGGEDWRDTALRLEGPAAAELQYFFLRTWRRHHGAPLDEMRYVWPARRPDPKVKVITSDLHRGRRSIRRAYRAAFRASRRRILITNSYFLPSHSLLRALQRAARRGVDVRVILAGTTDVRIVLLAARAIYGRLLKAGVRIYEWHAARVLHAKTAVIDGHWSTVGSSNLDALSLRRNLEVNAIVEDPDFAAALEALFEEDLSHCEEITPERWRQRPWWQRALSWMAYLFRDWL
jgi:cardiolipin synthase A/B